MDIGSELLLPVAAFIVPVLVVALLTWLFDSNKPKKKFPTHGRKLTQQKSA